MPSYEHAELSTPARPLALKLPTPKFPDFFNNGMCYYNTTINTTTTAASLFEYYVIVVLQIQGDFEWY